MRELADLEQRARRAVGQHVDGGKLMQRPDPPDAKRVLVGELVGALERRPRGTEVPHALPAADDVQRLDRDFGRPAGEPGRLGRRERPVRQLLGLVQLTGREREPRGRRRRPGLPARDRRAARRWRWPPTGARRLASALSSGLVLAALIRTSACRRGSEPTASSRRDQVLGQQAELLVVTRQRERLGQRLVDLDVQHGVGVAGLGQQFARVAQDCDRAGQRALGVARGGRR